jgi:hypothetical protein
MTMYEYICLPEWIQVLSRLQNLHHMYFYLEEHDPLAYLQLQVVALRIL